MRSILQGGLLLVGLMSITAVGTGEDLPQPPKPTHGKVEWVETYPTHFFLPTGQRNELEGYILAYATAQAEAKLGTYSKLSHGENICTVKVLNRDGDTLSTSTLYPEHRGNGFYRIGRYVPGDSGATPPLDAVALPWDSRRRTGAYDLTIYAHFTVPGSLAGELAPKRASTNVVTVNVPPPPKK